MSEQERLLEELAPYHRWAVPTLTRVAESDRSDPEKLKARLALSTLVDNDSDRNDYLLAQMLDSAPDDALVIARNETRVVGRTVEADTTSPAPRKSNTCSFSFAGIASIARMPSRRTMTLSAGGRGTRCCGRSCKQSPCPHIASRNREASVLSGAELASGSNSRAGRERRTSAACPGFIHQPSAVDEVRP